MNRFQLYWTKGLCDGCDKVKRRLISPTGRYQICKSCRRKEPK